jgi:hypothetical protein
MHPSKTRMIYMSSQENTLVDKTLCNTLCVKLIGIAVGLGRVENSITTARAS